MLAVQVIMVVAVVTAVLAMIIKALRYANAPEHMRWELYPVPHEKGRAEYGGSYLEELDWWSKPRHEDKLNELKEMAAEILLLKGVRHHNSKVWISSWPFHLGMYLSIGWLGLIFLGALLSALGVAVNAEAQVFGQIIHYVTIPFGYAALVLSFLGALGLFIWRMSDKDQRLFNAPIEYFNLVLIMIVTGIAFASHLTADQSFDHLRGFVQATMSISEAYVPSTLFTTEIVLLSILVAYIPVTRMSHFVAKYFLYHAVRWNDQPNVRGSLIEKRIGELLNQKVGWRGSHIQTGKTWGEVVTEVEDEK